MNLRRVNGATGVYYVGTLAKVPKVNVRSMSDERRQAMREYYNRQAQQQGQQVVTRSMLK